MANSSSFKRAAAFSFTIPILKHLSCLPRILPIIHYQDDDEDDGDDDDDDDDDKVLKMVNQPMRGSKVISRLVPLPSNQSISNNIQYSTSWHLSRLSFALKSISNDIQY